MIAIIDGCGSNIASVQFSLQRLGYESVLTHDPEIIQQASHIILPGVGHAKKAMQQLQQLGLVQVIRELKQPVLGICLGMQLLYDFSEEGGVDCFGIIPGRIARMPDADCVLPHMGWNKIEGPEKGCFALSGDANELNGYVYFVHSFSAPINDYTLTKTCYAEPFTSMVKRDNFVGMQFHPEKSGDFGERLLDKFLKGELV